MTIDATWQIEIGTKGAMTDYTSRVAGMNVKQRLGRARLGTGNAVVTMLNNDGALTPNAGGTYSSVDWFSQLVRINCTVTDGVSSETANVFSGIVKDFELSDDGRNSMVQLKMIDMAGILGQTETYTSLGYDTVGGIGGAITRVLRGDGATIPAVPTPTFGGTNSEYQPFTITAGSSYSFRVNHDGTPAAQQINDQILPSGPGFAWSTTTIFDTEGAFTDPSLYMLVVDYTLNRTLADSGTLKRAARPQTFTANPTGTELPINRLTTGWNHDEVRNQATVDGTYFGHTSQTTSNTASMNKYGVQSVTVNESGVTTDDEALEVANRWATLFDAPVYAATALTVKLSSIIDKCDNAAWQSLANLLDIQSGLWNTAAVEYTPTGSATQVTDGCLMFGRTINATPSDTTITVEFVPAANYQYFTLNSDVLGVLDQNRLL